MDTPQTYGGGDLAWPTVAACTLPTAQQPLRLAEFDDLFAATLRSVERLQATRARLLLAGDGTLAERVQQLADAESSCCAFFRFAVTTLDGGVVALDIEAPEAQRDVLAGLLARADAARRTAS